METSHVVTRRSSWLGKDTSAHLVPLCFCVGCAWLVYDQTTKCDPYGDSFIGSLLLLFFLYWIEIAADCGCQIACVCLCLCACRRKCVYVCLGMHFKKALNIYHHFLWDILLRQHLSRKRCLSQCLKLFALYTARPCLFFFLSFIASISQQQEFLHLSLSVSLFLLSLLPLAPTLSLSPSLSVSTPTFSPTPPRHCHKGDQNYTLLKVGAHLMLRGTVVEWKNMYCAVACDVDTWAWVFGVNTELNCTYGCM